MIVIVNQVPRPWSWRLSDEVMVWWESMKCLSPLPVSGVCWLHLHRLHTLPQSHVLNRGKVRTFACIEPLDKSSQCFFAEDITRSSTHVALFNEWTEPPAQVQRLLRVIFRQDQVKVLYHHKRVVVSFQKPVKFIQVVLVDVLEGTNGLPVQVVPPLSHIKRHSREVVLGGAHVQGSTAAPSPCLSYMPGSRVQVFGACHDPA